MSLPETSLTCKSGLGIGEPIERPLATGAFSGPAGNQEKRPSAADRNSEVINSFFIFKGFCVGKIYEKMLEKPGIGVAPGGGVPPGVDRVGGGGEGLPLSFPGNNFKMVNTYIQFITNE